MVLWGKGLNKVSNDKWCGGHSCVTGETLIETDHQEVDDGGWDTITDEQF